MFYTTVLGTSFTVQKNSYGFRVQESGGPWERAYPDTEKKEGLGRLTIYTNHPGGIVEYKHN